MSVITLNLVVLWVLKIIQMKKDIMEWWHAFKSKKNEEPELPSSPKSTIKYLRSNASNVIPNQFDKMDLPNNFNLIAEVNRSLKPEYQLKQKTDLSMPKRNLLSVPGTK